MEEIIDSEENADLVKKIASLANSTKMNTILKQNNELINNLHNLQKSKLYEMHKYEQIMNMPAKNVHAYLKKEFEKPTKILTRTEEVQEVLDRERERIKNDAATVIQRNFRKYVFKQKQEQIFHKWTHISPRNTSKLIERISERLSNQTVMPRTDLHVIKTKLAEHRARLKKEAEFYVKRENLLESIKKNVEFFSEDLHLGSPKLENLEIPNGSIGILAKKKQNEFMNKLEEEKILYAI